MSVIWIFLTIVLYFAVDDKEISFQILALSLDDSPAGMYDEMNENIFNRSHYYSYDRLRTTP